MGTQFETLDLCLRARASEFPDKELFTFLDDTGEKADELTYAELDRRAQAVAATLSGRGLQGQRVLLLFTPGLDFAVAFYGCMYAGAIAVPAYPPDPSRLDRTLPRLQAIAADAAPALVLTSKPILTLAQQHLHAFAPDLAVLEWTAVGDMVERGHAGAYRAPELRGDDLALIQYTSGSTSVPKGVMVSHRNLMVNMWMFQQVARHDQHRIIVSWLPTYHDLGLTSGIVLPVFVGARAVLMSPLDFLKNPAIWLAAVHRYKGTDTAVPNFALDLCARKISSEQRRAWDLSSIQVCLVAAEPIRHAAVERFLRGFEKQGLSRRSILPGYGLAETVAAVSCGPLGELWRTAFVDQEQLAQGRFTEVSPTRPDALPLVACGKACDQVTLAIVDPDTCLPAGAGQVGEVWVAGPHVALGYWQRQAESRQTFQLQLGHLPGRDFVRTGDLGCIKEEQLYITGRIKDLIIIRGKNHYPQDIELSVELSHPRIRPGAAIAFSFERDGSERLALVAEVDTRQLQSAAEKQEEFGRIVAAVRAAVFAAHGLQIASLTLVRQRTIDKTSSGKLARQSCKKRYLDKTLEKEFAWDIEQFQAQPASALPLLQPLPVDERRHVLCEYLNDEIQRLAPGAGRLDASSDIRLGELGLDSLAAMELAGSLESRFKVSLPILKLLVTATFGELLAQLLAATGAGQAAGDAAPRSQAIALSQLTAATPVFCVAGLVGIVSYLQTLAQALGDERPFITFQTPGIDGAETPLGSVEEMARRYLDEMQAIQPHGPYLLAGHSFGGLVAYEMAQQLAARQEEVRALLLIDSSCVAENRPAEQTQEIMALHELGNFFRRIKDQGQTQPAIAPEQLASMTAEQARLALSQEIGGGQALRQDTIDNLARVYAASFSAMSRYRPQPYSGPVTLLRAQLGLPQDLFHPQRRVHLHFGETALGWDRTCPGLKIIDVPGDHLTMVLEPHVETLAAALRSATLDTPRLAIGLERLRPARNPQGAGRAIEVRQDEVIFNPFLDEFLENPYPALHQLREHAPVHWDAAMHAWWVTRHADVVQGLRDKRFSVDSRSAADADGQDIPVQQESARPTLLSAWFRAQDGMPAASLYNDSMLFLDPPRHRQLRQCFAPLFESGGLQRWQPVIDERVDELVAEMRLRRDPDVMRDLALPLPLGVVSALLGIAQQDAALLAPWGSDIFKGFDPMLSSSVTQQINRSARNFAAYMHEHIAKRRKAPRQDDFLGHLLAQERDGMALGDQELAANCILLFVAGYETTTSVIGNSVLALLRNPGQLRLLRERPELAAGAVDEFLRYDGALRLAFRTALEDVELGGKLIRRGDAVVFSLAAANRDPKKFPDPDTLDLARDTKNHVAFSHGIHYCLGAPLAKLEIQSALKALCRHDFALAPGRLEWRQSLIFRSLNRLPIVFR